MAAPPTTCPRASTDGKLSFTPVKVSASTSQASVAPEKKVKPRPSSTDAIAQPQSGAWVCHIQR